MKLTAPQLKLLKELNKQPRYVAQNYPPLKILLRHNFVKLKEGKWTDSFEVTDHGKAHLASLENA
jgi:hypothetical protein